MFRWSSTSSTSSCASCPRCARWRDLISCGIESLIPAIDATTPPRVRLSSPTSGPASTARCSMSCAGAHGRPPSREERAEAVGMTPPQLRAKEQEIQNSDLSSLVATEGETAIELVDTLETEDTSTDPEREEPHASRDRRAGRLREPRIADPLAAQAPHPRAPRARDAAVHRSPPEPSRRPVPSNEGVLAENRARGQPAARPPDADPHLQRDLLRHVVVARRRGPGRGVRRLVAPCGSAASHARRVDPVLDGLVARRPRTRPPGADRLRAGGGDPLGVDNERPRRGLLRSSYSNSTCTCFGRRLGPVITVSTRA